MKRKNRKILFAVLLSFLLATTAGCGNKETTGEKQKPEKEEMDALTMETIYEANTKEQLLKTHDNLLIEDMDGQRYVDENKYYEKSQGEEVVFSGDVSYVRQEEKDGIWLGFDDSHLRYEDYNNLFFFEEFYRYEEIVKEEEKEGQLIVKTRIPNDVVLEFGAGLEDIKEGQFYENEYVLDKKTLEVQKVSAFKCMENEKPAEVNTCEVNYDEEEPLEVQEFYETMQDTQKMRTITIVLEPGSIAEQSFERRVERGEDFYMDLPDDYYEVYTDKEMTRNFTGSTDKETDLTLYTRKLLRVNC